jgi:hypothetical protein
MERRELFLGLAGLLVTPAIVRAEALMPVSRRVTNISRNDGGSASISMIRCAALGSQMTETFIQQIHYYNFDHNGTPSSATVDYSDGRQVVYTGESNVKAINVRAA